MSPTTFCSSAVRLVLPALIATCLIPLGASQAATLTDARITEFLSANDDGIEDSDGDRSDWIEVWNSSGIGGDLGGWYLTDDPENLTKWTFPAVEIGSGNYLLVFASGKDRTDLGSELHTNFKLSSAAGSYLALVEPDGTTVASEFSDYPEQFNDIAYGAGFETALPINLVETGDTARWHVPDGPVPGWEETGFNDETWSSGATGIGYDNPPAGDYLQYIGEGDDLRSAMRSENPTVYIRIAFEVPDPAGITDLILSAQWEDGFVAYLNGDEVHRERAPANPTWESRSNPTSGRTESLVSNFDDFPLTSGNLVAGTNVLAVQGLNDSQGSSDFLFSPRLRATQQNVTNLVAGFFPTPTPGDENGERFDGITTDTKFSTDRGTFDTPFDLEITTTTPDAIIRYTTDGSPPSPTSGTIYNGTINVTETSVIRAIAYKQGFRPTNVDTHTYIFPADVVDQAPMRSEITDDPTYGPQMIDALNSLPVLALSFDANDVNYTEMPTSVELIGFPDGPKQVDAGVVRFGGAFTNFAKVSVRLHFRSEYGPSRLNYPLFDPDEYEHVPPVENFDALDVRAGNHDMTHRGAYLSNRFTDDSLLAMGHVAPHGRHIHVYFNGNYRGMYHLRERWDAAMLASYLPGKESEFDTINANNTGGEFLTGVSQDGDLTEWNQVQASLTGGTPYASTRDLLDVPNLIDFMLLWTSGNAESEFRSGGSSGNGVGFKFMIKDADGHLRPPGRPVTHNGPLNAMTRYRSEGDPDYEMLLADRIHKHFFNGGAMTSESLVARHQRRVDQTGLAFIAEAARWGSHAGRTNHTPGQWQSYQNNLLNNTLPNLTATQMTKFRNANFYPDTIAPVLSQHGGSIPAGGAFTMTTNGNRLYYTLDGSDPRLPGGNIDPNATLAPFENELRDPEDFVLTGAVWKYLDDGSDQGTAWYAKDFDDSTWAEGPSQIGYMEADQATHVGFIDIDPNRSGSQRNATTYFRHKVNISEPGGFSFFELNLLYDDGAAVYVNGNEVVRTDNLPAGATFDTYATSGTPNENAFFEFIVPSSAFVDGENTIAVEIHNVTENSSDISLDLRLRGEIDTTNGANISEPIALTEPALVRSRAYNTATGEWSALSEAFFSINSIPATAANLVISEIHYHPAEPTEAGEIAISTDRDDYEFIELMNIANQPIELGDVYFSNGIDFAFPENQLLAAGGRIVLVSDAEAFAERYGGAVEIGGNYSGQLRNSGEALALSVSDGADIRNFSFGDDSPWPTLPDGGGFSLVLLNPTSNPDHALPENWGTHADVGGAPGQADSTQASGYEAWKTANNITSDDQDDDEDGLGAIIEYALGTSLSAPSNSSLPTAGMITIGADTFLTLSFEKNPLANDIDCQLQSSRDLTDWTDEDSVEESSGTYRLTTPLPPGEERVYLRLSVSLR